MKDDRQGLICWVPTARLSMRISLVKDDRQGLICWVPTARLSREYHW